jgi:hypothetical protein
MRLQHRRQYDPPGERIALVPVILGYPAWARVADIAAELGETRWFVSSVRLGLRLRDVCPELPRPGKRSTDHPPCVQWVPSADDAPGRCRLGIPEACPRFCAPDGCGSFYADA